MKIGVDYWDTITRYPKVFRDLLTSLDVAGNEIYVITACRITTSKKSYTEKVKAFLEREEIPYDHIIVVQFRDWIEVPELKVEAAQTMEVSLFIDDRQDVCDTMQRRGIAALHVVKSNRAFVRKGGEMQV